VVLFAGNCVGNAVSGAVGDADEPVGEADGTAVDVDITCEAVGALVGVDVKSVDKPGIPLRIFDEIPIFFAVGCISSGAMSNGAVSCVDYGSITMI